MAKAKKLPSGMWRVQVYSHTDENGKKIRESFTAPTKTEAEMMAAQFANSRDRQRAADLTVKEAVQKYIDLNEAVLSPATVTGYTLALQRMKPIYNLRIRKIASADVQKFISDMTSDYSPKTIKNTYGLLHKALTFFDPDLVLRVHLPKQKKKTAYSPSSEDVVVLFENASRRLQLAIALAAFHSFREGEIGALKFKDLEGNRLHVHADLVKDRNGVWIYKEYPKTDDSDRYAKLPQYLVDFIGTGDPEEYIVGWKPGTISKRFYELKKKLGIEVRFHDLRHYYASVAAGIVKIPDIYTASFGGWAASGTTMKSVYQNKIVSMEDMYADKMNEYFDSLVHTKVHTENKKAAK